MSQTIDEIFNELENFLSTPIGSAIKGDCLTQKEAKDQLYELMLGVIGEDERLIKADPYQIRSLEIRRNDLRAEQRVKLKEVFGK
jgi:hypothetical protein